MSEEITICRKYTRQLQSHGSREFTFLLRPRLLCNCMDPNHTHFHHTFWSCSKIQPFWDHIHVMLCKVLGYKISQTCIVLILGHIVGSVHNGDYDLGFSCCLKKTITKNWLQSYAPDYRDWLNIIGNIQKMGRLTYRLKTMEDSFSKGWDKW